MRTICDNFSLFFTPKNILVIHPFVGQLSAWSFPRLVHVLLFQNLRSGEPTHRRRLAHWRPCQEMMRFALPTRAVAVSLRLVKFALEASLIRHCLPLSSLISRCVYFNAKTWSCVVQCAQEQLLYG